MEERLRYIAQRQSACLTCMRLWFNLRTSKKKTKKKLRALGSCKPFIAQVHCG